jgi:serine/threonine protein phosphatase 1
LSDPKHFAVLAGNRRIWAVGAIHGESERLTVLHSHIADFFTPGDQIVYLGNYLGQSEGVFATINELLLFRRWVIAWPDSRLEDVVHLRGGQEEMWQKLLQLQFAPNPAQVLQWMGAHGVEATLNAYGSRSEEGLGAVREGALAITRWTSGLAQAIRAHDGHMALLSSLKHAAFSDDQRLLFVHAGVDPSRPLLAQSDAFWWGGHDLSRLIAPYEGYGLIIRGYDSRHNGICMDEYAATLDGGCGFGGPLAAACFAPDGSVPHFIEV